jgi:hypothetical protein
MTGVVNGTINNTVRRLTIISAVAAVCLSALAPAAASADIRAP